MIDKKMSDEQIIKALECCIKHTECMECPMKATRNCMTELMKAPLDLINRKDAEIESLKADKIIAERHEKDARELYKDVVIQLKTAKSEAYKEFAERVHQNCEKYPYTLPSVFTNIEITYKELTEGGNEDGMD